MSTGVGRTGFVKIYGKHMPVGYFGRYSGHGVSARLAGDQTAYKMLKGNCDKVLGAGLRAELWREVITSRNPDRTPAFDPQLDQTTLTNDGYPLCSCVKETSKSPDNKCRSCYGTGIIPGYTKFGYSEYDVASIDSSLTLANTSLYTDITPFRLHLTPGQLSGTIETLDYPVNNPGGHAFEYQAETYIRQASGTSIIIEFSVDNGTSWSPIAGINTPTPTSGTIRFRITLTRTLAADRSPMFEILRVRHARIDEPYIRVLKGLPTRSREKGAYGVVDSDGSWRWWTVPLRHFDPTIAQDPDVVTPPEDNLIQQSAFVDFLDGVHTGQRFELVNFEYHDPLGIFISQGFSCRKLQKDEIQHRVF